MQFSRYEERIVKKETCGFQLVVAKRSKNKLHQSFRLETCLLNVKRRKYVLWSYENWNISFLRICRVIDDTVQPWMEEQLFFKLLTIISDSLILPLPPRSTCWNFAIFKNCYYSPLSAPLPVAIIFLISEIETVLCQFLFDFHANR